MRTTPQRSIDFFSRSLFSPFTQDGPTQTSSSSSSSYVGDNIGPVRDGRDSVETPKQKRVAEDTEKLAAVKEVSVCDCVCVCMRACVRECVCV